MGILKGWGQGGLNIGNDTGRWIYRYFFQVLCQCMCFSRYDWIVGYNSGLDECVLRVKTTGN